MTIRIGKVGGARRATEAITQLRKEAVKNMVKAAVEFVEVKPKEERFLKRTGVIRAKPSR